MITAYRIVRKKWSQSAFDGEGARLYGGRWNSKGKPCVYVAGSESLAILEVLVHLQNSQALTHYVLLSIEIDEQEMLTLQNEDLPKNWQENPAPSDTSDLGDEWLASKSSLALSVPSTIVTRERNYLLNVSHPRFLQCISSITEHDFTLDSRLL